MTSAIDKNQTFDAQMRTFHEASLSRLSSPTLARLRTARHGLADAPVRPGRGWRWVLASAFSAVLAVAIGVQLLPGPATDLATAPIAAASPEDEFSEAVTALDESPDLYLWLASQDAATLAME